MNFHFHYALQTLVVFLNNFGDFTIIFILITLWRCVLSKSTFRRGYCIRDTRISHSAYTCGQMELFTRVRATPTVSRQISASRFFSRRRQIQYLRYRCYIMSNARVQTCILVQATATNIIGAPCFSGE
jgi:hypothetical protein